MLHKPAEMVSSVSSLLAGILSCLLIGGTLGDCPGGWIEWSHSCYLLEHTAVEHSAALALCGLYNASLVSVASGDEFSALSGLIKAAGVPSYGQSVEYWTGLAYSGHSYSWTDGSAFDRSVIHLEQPQAPAVKCSVWDSSSNAIHFVACGEQHRPFCKRPKSFTFIDKCNEADGWQDISGACYKLFDVTNSWRDARQQCIRNNGDLYNPGNTPYVINRLISCRISVSHIWLGVSDITHPGILMTSNGTQATINWSLGSNAIVKLGNTCVQVVTTSTDALLFETDLCDHEKQFICQKPYGTCPGGWEEHQGRCYQVQSTTTAATTWFLAKQHCALQGAELLILNSMDEHLFISQKLFEYGVPRIWLGFSDEAKDNILSWVDGSPASGNGTFGVWAPRFPYPLPGKPDCGILQVGSSNGTWSHGYCYDARSYVCELHIGKALSSQPSPWANYTCDSGWSAFQDQCFLFASEQNTWDNASSDCVSNNAHLATITDPYIQSFLRMNLPDAANAWIGLKMDTNNNKYHWSSSHSEVNFTNYMPGEPNGADQGFYCLEMVSADTINYPGAWVDHNCSDPQDYICQKPATLTGSTPQPPTFAWSTRCDPGWRLNSKDNFCYLVATGSPKTWLEASYDCQRRGANLLSVSGPNEQLHIEAVLGTAYPGYQDLWIGASDSTTEGGWEWSDGTPFRYLHWHPGEPNNQHNTEDCAEMVVRWNYQWNDRNCADSLDYICKKAARPLATSPTPAIPTLVPATKCLMGPTISGTYSIQSPFAFTSSSDLDSNHTASNIRLSENNLSQFNASWRPQTDQKGEWVGVNYYQTMSFESISIAGEQNSFSYVTKFKVQYQYTVHSPWYWVESSPGNPQVFDGPTDDSSSTAAFFPEVIHAQSVRVFPQEWGSHIAVRFELNGCVMDGCSMDYAISGPLVVMDGGFTASSMSDYEHNPHSARLHPISPYDPPSCWRTGDPFDVHSPPWIVVNLGSIKLLRGVTIMGNPDADEYVTSFQLHYKLNDGSDAYIPYQEPYGVTKNFTGNSDHNSTSITLLKSVLPARYVRLVITGYHGNVALRFDLLVCSLATCKDIPLLSGKHNVSNSAFTASSSLDPQHGPYHSRLGGQALGALGGAWVAKFQDAHQYIQVDLGEIIRVWAVATQGSEDLQQFVRAYTLAVSTDGKLFSTYSANEKDPTVFDGNFDTTTVRKHYLSVVTQARYVQLWPSDYEGGIALRWEIYGCPGPESGQYMGCFLDEPSARDLPYEPLVDVYAHIGPTSCRYHCYDKGYAYAGIQRGTACYCGNSYGKYGGSLDACTSKCLPPFEKEICGGHLANTVYTTGLSPPFDYCDPGWVKHGASCYMMPEDMRSWFSAHEACHQQGGELVSVDSRMENDFVFSTLLSMVSAGLKRGMWMGLNDIQETYFYQWNDGSEVTYTNWDVNMPVTDPSQEQHCVAMNNQTGGWKTMFCEETLLYMCKSPAKPSQIPHIPSIALGCEKTGWSAFKESCYNLIDEAQSWSDAQRACHASGGTLVRIGDRYEQAFVSSLLGSKTGYFWTDVRISPSSFVSTFSDQSTVTYTNWGRQQPVPNKHCVALGTGQAASLWNTLDCSSIHHAVCEKTRTGFTPVPTPPLVPPGARCPMDWYETHLSCFQLNVRQPAGQLTWDEAREDCQNQGADLASFHSHEDLETIWQNHMTGVNGNFWIGLIYNDQDQSLKWSDGSGVNFLQWAAGESDALQGLKNCGEIRVDTGDMAHQSCFARRNWVCSVARGVVPKARTTVIAPTPASPGSCRPRDDSWKMYGRACYYVELGAGDNAMTWREAKSWCNNMQTELVSITTPEEQLFVESLIRGVSSVGLWIGLNKLDVGHGFKWSDGSPVDYTHWDVNEPNNFGYLEYCADILPRNGKWNDEICTRKRGFICKQAPYITVAPTGISTTTPVWGYCPAGYSEYQHTCLRVYGGSEGEQLLSWAEAWDSCSKRGPTYNLASVGEAEKNLFIVSLLGSNQLSAWLGLRRLGDGTYVWTDNSEVTYTNWDDGEPSGGVQSCIYMKGTASSAGVWSDAPCGQKANYVCETLKDPHLMTPEATPTPCDADIGFYPYKSGCYQYRSLGVNWTTAAQECHKYGANLVTINDAFTQAHLQLFVVWSMNDEYEINYHPTVWIGLNDRQERGVYKWTLGWPMTYSNWGPEEPSRGPNEGCVKMATNGLWSDEDCSKELPFVCAIINENYTTFTPKPPRGQCVGSEWVLYGDFCFLLRGDDPRTFYEAQLSCQEQQGQLTSVHDNATAQFLVNMVIGQTAYNIWIGLYNSQTAGFNWVDETAVDFTNWAASEPSGTNSEGVAEHCVGLDPRTQLWSDLDCDLHLGYVCRKRQDVDISHNTRPPVVGPDHSPPKLNTVSQKTPVTVTPTSKATGTSHSTSRSNPPTSGSNQPFSTKPTSTHSATVPQHRQTGSQTHSTTTVQRPHSRTSQHPHASITPSGVLPTNQGITANNGSHLSSGAVAAIVICVLLVAGAGATLLFLYWRRRRQVRLTDGEGHFANVLFGFSPSSSGIDAESIHTKHEAVNLTVFESERAKNYESGASGIQLPASGEEEDA